MMHSVWADVMSWDVWQQWDFSRHWPLWCLPLALLPVCLRGFVAFAHPAVQGLPEDVLSIWVARLWRGAAALLLAALCVALAGPTLNTQQIEKLGRGAHVMIVLDRSASMNDPFAKPAGVERGSADARVSKMVAARDVLKTMVKQGREDLMGMVTFSTSPILAAPLGSDRGFVQAALEATEAGGMGFTAVARGLGMALDYFSDQPVTGARAIVLVSDGGAHLDGKTQDMLRAMFMRQQASLYWIYLRSEHGASLKQAPGQEESVDAYPEYALHEYFQSLHVPYHVYEAENPQTVAAAIQDIARLKNKPTRYMEPVSRVDLSGYFYVMACLACVLLCVIDRLELKQWQLSSNN